MKPSSAMVFAMLASGCRSSPFTTSPSMWAPYLRTLLPVNYKLTGKLNLYTRLSRPFYYSYQLVQASLTLLPVESTVTILSPTWPARRGNTTSRAAAAKPDSAASCRLVHP